DPVATNVVGGGIAITPGGGATVTATLTNNNLQGAKGSAIIVDTTSGTAALPTTALVKATISGNTIGTAGTARSGSYGGDGIQLGSNGGSTMSVLVTGNQVFQYTNVAG